MKIQTVKFPSTPEATMESVKEMRPFIDRYFTEVEGQDSTDLPNEVLVMSWHGVALDFIEVLDGDKRIGLIMNQFVFNELDKQRYAKLMIAYIEPEYRGQGIFKRMIDYMKTVYQARNIAYIDVVVSNDQPFTIQGKEVARIIRMEL